jgi:hypothetical protein
VAKPTITGVAPTTIWTGGQVVTITGTNFATWSLPAVTAWVLPAPTPTAQVLIGGVACTVVAVISATQIQCLAPAHDAGVVAVVVTNLAAGVAITGETSDPGTLTYARPSLTSSQDLERLNEQVVVELRRQVLANVLMFVSVDFAEDSFDFTVVGDLPALVLSGPTIVESENAYVRNSEVAPEAYPTMTFDVFRAPPVVHLQYDLVGLTNNTRQLINLQVAVTKFFEKNTKITIPRNPADLSLGYISYDMERPAGTPLRATTSPNKNDIRSFDMSFQVLGVPIEGLGGFEGENLVRRGGVVEQVTTVSVRLDV